MDLGLKGKVALVTGASWGIGREIALNFAREGANVVIHYHSHGQEAEGVALEAAALGKPVLCFADSGGMPEFVEDDAGFVVPYLDLAAMAERIAALAVDTTLRARLGKRAAEKVCGMYDIAAGSKRIERIISKIICSQSA